VSQEPFPCGIYFEPLPDLPPGARLLSLLRWALGLLVVQNLSLNAISQTVVSRSFNWFKFYIDLNKDLRRTTSDLDSRTRVKSGALRPGLPLVVKIASMGHYIDFACS
jgi:hypothetical protein